MLSSNIWCLNMMAFRRSGWGLTANLYISAARASTQASAPTWSEPLRGKERLEKMCPRHSTDRGPIILTHFWFLCLEMVQSFEMGWCLLWFSGREIQLWSMMWFYDECVSSGPVIRRCSRQRPTFLTAITAIASIHLTLHSFFTHTLTLLPTCTFQ